ncbi:Pol Polyprotein [Phytophthora megakarya]|uniref:Pol Polyprotein n=1 Tax=Phytophthora megakarya TaxID=4795 RepID=A0A225UK32_9STRA|nr:Pol Polyprotein [Phytophthora megakarya]
MVFKHHGMPNDFVSERDPRFTARFWQEMFTLLGTQFSMSTADHPQTDGQTIRMINAQSFNNWSDYLPFAEFAINNATPFFVNAMRHPHLPSTLEAWSYAQSFHNWSNYLPMAEFAINNAVHASTGHTLFFVKSCSIHAFRARSGWQKLNADNVGRGNTNEFKVGSLVLLSTQNLPTHAVSGFGASKLVPHFIGPFSVAERHGSAYTLELPSNMRLHPTFYVGRLKPYLQPESSSRDDSPTTTRGATSASPQASSPPPGEDELVPTPQHGSASAT